MLKLKLVILIEEKFATMLKTSVTKISKQHYGFKAGNNNF